MLKIIGGLLLVALTGCDAPTTEMRILQCKMEYQRLPDKSETNLSSYADLCMRAQGWAADATCEKNGAYGLETCRYIKK